MKEVWKDVPGYEGFYKVSNKGRIQSLTRKIRNNTQKKLTDDNLKEIRSMKRQQIPTKNIARCFGVTHQAITYQLSKQEESCTFKREGKVLDQSENTYGYPVVGLCKDSKIVTRPVHRLVAQAFIPNPEEKPEVNHKDGNKKNNLCTNLEWNTSEENRRHALETGLFNSKGSKNPNSKLTEEDVIKIRSRIMAGEQQKLIAREYKITQEMVSLIKRRRFWKHC